MNEAETRHEVDGNRPLGTWLGEGIRLSVPRYWILLAACAAVALVLVALD